MSSVNDSWRQIIQKSLSFPETWNNWLLPITIIRFMDSSNPFGSSSRSQKCLVCQKDILISYKEHPDTHSGCLQAWEGLPDSEKEFAKARSLQQRASQNAKPPPITSNTSSISSSSSFSRTLTGSQRAKCDLCYKDILIPFAEHPTLHTLCFAKWNRGERPKPAPKPSDIGASPYPGSTSVPPRFSGPKFDIHARMAAPGAFDTFSIPLKPTETAAPTSADPVERILACNNYYHIFEVSKSASEEVLRAQFKKLAITVHPDRNKTPGSTDAFKKVIRAWDCLSNPQRRRKYDESGYDENGTDQQEVLIVERWRMELLVELVNSLSSMVMGNLPYK
jgi:hypothetical protein